MDCTAAFRRWWDCRMKQEGPREGKLEASAFTAGWYACAGKLDPDPNDEHPLPHPTGVEA